MRLARNSAAIRSISDRATVRQEILTEYPPIVSVINETEAPNPASSTSDSGRRLCARHVASSSLALLALMASLITVGVMSLALCFSVFA